MSKVFLTPIKLVNLSSDPVGHAGDIYFNNNLNALKYYNGSSWVTIGASTLNNIDGGSSELNDIEIEVLDGGSSVY